MVWSEFRADGAALITREARREVFHDLYHFLVSLTWPRFFLLAAGAFLALNLVFGAVFATMSPDELVGMPPVAGAARFLQCFFFSVHTFATIGYGHVSPVGTLANWIVVIEAFTGLLFAALLTGLLFSRFSRPSARVLFSDVAVIMQQDDVCCLAFRMTNERFNQIVEAQTHVVLATTGKTKEGKTFRYLHDLPLRRTNQPLFSLTWTVLHPIDEKSPLWNMTREELAKTDPLVIVTLSGVDETISQTVHARHVYNAETIAWNRRFVDVVVRGEDGRIGVDLDKFHETEPENC